MNGFTEKIDRGIFLFLGEGRYRWARHLVLFMVSLLIAGSNIYTEFKDTEGVKAPLLFSVALWLPIYLNVFLLTPVFLLRNRTGWFIFLAIAVVCCSLLLALYAQLLTGRPLPDSADRKILALVSLSSATSSLILIIAGTSAFMLVQQKVRNARRIEELENATIRSELEQLKNQINPHFLFNMLNNANVLVRDDPEEAEKVLRKLSDLLSYQFVEAGKERVRLGDEIVFLGDFLKLESIRRDRFEYAVLDMDCPAGIEIPPLLFIPFVENAVKHGNQSRTSSYILLVFRATWQGLDFMCTNSKPPKAEREQLPGGLGLANIRRRLQLLYPEKHRLAIHRTETTYTVHLHIDFS